MVDFTEKINFVRSLSGHSGCHLRLYSKNGEFFLRKDAGLPSYNYRLKKQYIKQEKFSLDKVKTPKVLGYGTEKNLFYFDMEFINSVTLAEYMKNIKIKEINHLITLLFSLLPIEEGILNNKSAECFKAKIKELNSKIPNSNEFIKTAFKKLDNFDFSNVPYSFCCGDLTLENILFTDNKEIYLIDFLDSFYNSWMIDVAKLLQDLELGWSYRNHKKSFNLNLRLAVAKEALLENILEYPSGEQNILTIYHILLLNLMRIFPYTHNEKTQQFLNDSVKKILTIIKTLEEKI